MHSGKIVSAGANGDVVQWQAFFFVPPPPFLGPPPASSTHNTAAETTLSHRENDRDQTGPRPRRVPGTTDPSASDEQPGAAADGVDMDYQTTLAREDDGEISLSGLMPRGERENRRRGRGRGNGANTAGEVPTAFEVGLGPAVEAGTLTGQRKGIKRTDPAAPESEESRKGGTSPDADTVARVEIRPESAAQGEGGAQRVCSGAGSIFGVGW